MKRIAVFGSSTALPQSGEYELAFALGKALAENRWGLLSGGYAGTMEALAKGCRLAGGKCTGIAVDEFRKLKSPNNFQSEVVFEAELFQRTRRLIDSADAIVVLDGNLGTLFELLGIWVLSQSRLLSNNLPVILAGAKVREFVKYVSANIGVPDAETEIGRFEYCHSVEDIILVLRHRLSSPRAENSR